MNFAAIGGLSEEEIVEFLQEKGILHRVRRCDEGHLMEISRYGSGRTPVWRCGAVGCRCEVSIRKGTWFEGPRRRVPLKTAVLFMYLWCCNLTTIETGEVELGMSKNATIAWNQHLRMLAAEATSRNPQSTECLRGSLKRPMRPRSGMNRSMQRYYLAEKVWRRRVRGRLQRFEQLLADISTLYPPS